MMHYMGGKTETQMYHGLLPEWSGVGKVCARASIASELSWFLVWIAISQLQSPALYGKQDMVPPLVMMLL